MSTLEPRYARYGLMASRTLAALDDLEERAARSTHVVPTPEDAERIERLQRVLEAAFAGGAAPDAQLVYWLGGRARADTDVDDSMIVKRVLQGAQPFEEFIDTALKTLQTIRTDGLDALKAEANREQLDFYPTLRDFLDRLAQSSQSGGVSSRRSARRRYALG